MQNILTSKAFWFTAVIVGAVFFAIGLKTEALKTNQSEIRLLLLPKSETAARNANQIILNATEIPRSLSFYNKAVELNEAIDDKFSALPDSQRKAAWNDKIKIERVGKSGVVKIVVADEDSWQAQIISLQIADSLMTVMGRYYGAQNLEFKTLDGQIVSQSLPISGWIKLGLFSLLIALLIGGALAWLVNIFAKEGFSWNFQGDFWKKCTKPTSVEKADPLFSKYFSIVNSSKPMEEKKSNKNSLVENILPADEVYQIEKKAVAPENLPIIEEEIFPLPEKVEKKKNPFSAETVVRQALHEATSEEVKARLNKLLNS
jgi:capsular polysaccharide biosynthesis protein